MKDYQERVIAERKELNNKIVSLNNFLYSDLSINLTFRERDLMKDQLQIMMQYSSIIMERINNFV